jgi:hypothetical protein
MAEDPDFVKQASADFVTNLIAMRLQSGKVPFERELAILEQQSWGSCVDAAIEKIPI